MSRTLQFLVTIPEIPDRMSNEEAQDWLFDCIGHPEDAYFEHMVTVEPVTPQPANPERDGNGCMIYQQSAKEGQ